VLVLRSPEPFFREHSTGRTKAGNFELQAAGDESGPGIRGCIFCSGDVVMLGFIFDGRFSGARKKFTVTSAEISRFTRKLDAKALARSLIYSDVFGADTYTSRSPEPDQHDNGRKAVVKIAAWDAALDFSPPSQIVEAECPQYVARSAGRKVRDAIRARVSALLIAAILVLLWIGVVQSNPLPQQRNPDADAVADKFSGGGQPVRPPVTESSAPSFDTLEDAGIIDARFDFAPRLGDLIDSDSIVAGPDDVTDAASSVPLSSDAGLILIRNLPAGTVLSAGRRISATDWALTRSDVGNVTVTLPANRRGPVKATIEVFSMSGSQAGTMVVEIREARVRQAAVTKRSRLYRPAGERRPRSAAQKNRAAAKNAKASNSTSASGAPPQAARQGSPVTAAANTSAFPQLPFLPGPTGAANPSSGNSVGQEILLNLGLSATTPDLALAPKN
jgi:hypothetical protein